MAAKHNCYFGPFCPKNTISCGANGRHSQYIGLRENTLLTTPTYDPDPAKAT
jgi:hypothetical protein